ncbi:MAG: hypothetical protein E6R04_06430 [Spirochaetes bacterium]|nr:MAG: hypothetical protein E6R04_06430 [Spirochaetota bacterium]
MKGALDRLMEIETRVAMLTFDVADMKHAARKKEGESLEREYDRIVRRMPEVIHVNRVGVYKGE